MAKISTDQALLKAKSHAKKGEIEDAKKLYQSVLQAFPKNVRAQQGLAALSKMYPAEQRRSRRALVMNEARLGREATLRIKAKPLTFLRFSDP